MAPAAVQTKHSVRTKTTRAPAVSRHRAIASPDTLSRSPRTIAFLPLRSISSPPLHHACDFALDRLQRRLAAQAGELDPFPEEHVRGQPEDPHVPADLSVLRGVDLDDVQCARVRMFQCVDLGHKGKTRLTVRAPEIDKDIAL